MLEQKLGNRARVCNAIPCNAINHHSKLAETERAGSLQQEVMLSDSLMQAN